MTIKDGDIIRIDLTESVDGEVIASTNEDVAIESGIHDKNAQYGPRLIVVGYGLVVPGLNEELEGKEVGYSGEVDVPPEKAYGAHDPEKVETFSITKFKEEKPFVGMHISIDNRRNGVVSRIIGRKVWIDFNHPLADKTIKYDYKIIERIEGDLEKVKAITEMFAGAELETKIAEDAVEIYAPWELNYYQEWIVTRRKMAAAIIDALHFKEVRYIEQHTAEQLGFVPHPESEEVPVEESSDEEGAVESASENSAE